MEIINKNNKNITEEDIKQMYEIYYDNLPENKKNDKEDLAKEIIQNNNLLCSMFYDNSKLIGYIIIYLNEDENFIREFEIIKDYQHDGKTFKDMIKMALPYTNIENKYTGYILNYNNHAKTAFRRIGALIKDEKYFCTYDRIMKCLSIESGFFIREKK